MRLTIQQAKERLEKGDVVAVPTETVYGLAASLYQPDAIKKIFILKNRPSDNPLIIHVATQEELIPYLTEIPPGFNELAEAFWPGPLTLVMPVDVKKIPEEARAGLPGAAFRIPQHEGALELLRLTGPLVMPSANVSGRPSSTSPCHVEEDFGKEFPVIDGGPSKKGVESTILIRKEGAWHVGRLGAISLEAIRKVVGEVVMMGERKKAPLCPGQSYRHYAPSSTLSPWKGEEEGVILGFSDREYPQNTRLISLGPSKEPETITKRLYDALRQLDAEGIPSAFVDMNLPDEGLFLTIKDRLQKAIHR